jgi:hypothetical protein
MSEAIFQDKHISKYFKPSEFDDPHYPGSGIEMNTETIIWLYDLRMKCKWPIIPHGKVGGCVDMDGKWGHEDRSYHLKKQGCKAVDFHFESSAPIRQQIWYVIKESNFNGIGLYFDWMWNGNVCHVGFHVDIRPAKEMQLWKRVVRGIYKGYEYLIP